MNKPLIVILQQDSNRSRPDLTQLWQMLEMLGYQVQMHCQIRQIIPILDDIAPDIFILDRPMPEKISSSLSKTGLTFDLARFPQIVLEQEKGRKREPQLRNLSHEFPFDILALHGQILKNLVRHPRKHLRLAVQLPCVFFQKGMCFFGEILSLGTGGAFIKTTCHHLRVGDILDLGIPLIGMKKEIEVRGRVLYVINPRLENNYLQGVGVGFLPNDPKTPLLLQDFIKFSLLNEINLGSPNLGPNALQGVGVGRPAVSSNVIPPRLYLKS